MNRIRRMIQQAVPRNYKTVVTREGRKTLVLWKMWLGRSYDVVEFSA
jgi:hypothetical protein